MKSMQASLNDTHATTIHLGVSLQRGTHNLHPLRHRMKSFESYCRTYTVVWRPEIVPDFLQQLHETFSNPTWRFMALGRCLVRGHNPGCNAPNRPHTEQPKDM